MKLATFDVFDTVLTRTVADPSALFLVLGRRLAREGKLQVSAEAFARARSRAEQMARHNARSGEVTLDTIYTELAAILHVTGDRVAGLARRELDLERELSRPVPGADAMIAAAREKFGRVAYLSDMYLPAIFIRSELEKHGFWKNGDCIYVSSEHGCSKGDGGLYHKLAADQRIPRRHLQHHGNNLRTDVRRARWNGVHAVHTPGANLNRYERLLADQSFETEGLSSAMAAASRMSRMTVSAKDNREVALRDVAAGVVAPVLTSYVLWTLSIAERLGLARLHYMSRDGQILYEIARKLAPKLSAKCDVRYLYGSRQACHQPSVVTIGRREIAWLFEGVPLPTVRRGLSRFLVSPEEVAEELKRFGIQKDAWDTPAPIALGDAVQSDVIKSLILERAKATRSRLAAYLRQEGLYGPEKYAIVDTGWMGRIQGSLASVIAPEAAHPPIGLYFGLHDRTVDPKAGDQHTFFFDGLAQTGHLKLSAVAPVLAEMFCLADHGMVVGFTQSPEGRIEPVLKQTANAFAWEWGAAKVRETVLRFVDELHLNAQDVNPYADMRQCVAGAFRAFWNRPSMGEARAWGGFPYEDDQSGDLAQTIARSYGPKDVFAALLRGSVPRPHACGWAAGSWRLSSLPFRVAVSASARVGRALRAAAPRKLMKSAENAARQMYREGRFDKVPGVKAFLRTVAS